MFIRQKEIVDCGGKKKSQKYLNFLRSRGFSYDYNFF